MAIRLRARFNESTTRSAFAELGNADSTDGRTRFSRIHREPLCAYLWQQKDRELLLRRALGRKAESHSLRAREIGRAMLWHVNVSAGSDAGGDHVAAKLGMKSDCNVILSKAKLQRSARSLRGQAFNLGSNFGESYKCRQTEMFESLASCFAFCCSASRAI
jgi:hypothetical protein